MNGRCLAEKEEQKELSTEQRSKQRKDDRPGNCRSALTLVKRDQNEKRKKKSQLEFLTEGDSSHADSLLVFGKKGEHNSTFDNRGRRTMLFVLAVVESEDVKMNSGERNKSYGTYLTIEEVDRSSPSPG